jgi:hypothetical protein
MPRVAQRNIDIDSICLASSLAGRFNLFPAKTVRISGLAENLRARIGGYLAGIGSLNGQINPAVTKEEWKY